MRYTLSLLTGSLIALNSFCLAQAGPPQIPVGPLGDVDTTFLQEYVGRMKATAETQPTYIEIAGNNLILHRNGHDESARVIPDIYHALKDVAHIPFLTYLHLSPLAAANSTLTDEQVSQLQEIDAKIVAAQGALQDGHFSEAQMARQVRMIDASLALLRNTVKARRIDRSTLDQFAQTMGPLLMENSDEGGCYQVQETHAQMMKWKSTMTQEEWNRLIVINKSGHQPRYRNVATQYFGWLFNTADAPRWAYPGESDRVIYAEALPPKQSAGDELVSIMIDADASAAFFGNRWRLSEDILSDGAARCIAQLNPADRVWHQ